MMLQPQAQYAVVLGKINIKYWKGVRWGSSNSKAWMKRHLTDPYVVRSQREGTTSRAYYKLQEMDQKHQLLTNTRSNDDDDVVVVVDLGAAPGGWTSYVVHQLSAPRERRGGGGGSRSTKSSMLICIDLLPLDARVQAQLADSAPLVSSHVFQGDFRDGQVQTRLQTLLLQSNNKASLVLSDMAANTMGDSKTDAVRTMALCESALNLILEQDLLRKGGSFVGKFFSCPDDMELKRFAKIHFEKVQVVKPPASRKNSPEQYLVAKNFHG